MSGAAQDSATATAFKKLAQVLPLPLPLAPVPILCRHLHLQNDLLLLNLLVHPLTEHAAECYALSKLRSTTLSAMTDDESARLALRCLARRAVEAPPADDLHYRS